MPPSVEKRIPLMSANRMAAAQEKRADWLVCRHTPERTQSMSANRMAAAQEKRADQLVCRHTPETEQVEPTRDSLLPTYVKSNNHKNKDRLIRLALTHASHTSTHKLCRHILPNICHLYKYTSPVRHHICCCYCSYYLQPQAESCKH